LADDENSAKQPNATLWVAIAGIVATAVVGLAGATSGWLIARDDRANQRQLAHDARVYERRADAYVAAVAALRAYDSALRLYQIHAPDPAKRAQRKTELSRSFSALEDSALASAVLVFGSTAAFASFSQLRSDASDVSDVGDDPAEFAAFKDSTEHHNYEQQESQFIRVVQSELS
jgi:hypothetical protein